jgi:hypothetical protein
VQQHFVIQIKLEHIKHFLHKMFRKMVNVPGSNVQPLLNCLEDCKSPPEDKTDAYLRLAE